MAAETRFNLDDILGNEVVDFAVLDANQQILGNNAAHLSLGNSFTGMQEVHRPAAGNPALQVRLDADVTPRLTITADGAINWAATSISAAAGVLTIGGTTLRTPTLQTAAGTAAAPAQSFTTDTGTGFFSPSSGILGVAVGGVETNRVSNQGEIRFNRTNARISAYTTDDPATPGERLVNINALTVTPGRLYAASLTVNGNSQVSGNEVVTGTLSVSGQGTFTGVLQAGGAINAYGGMVHFEASNVVNIQWRGDLAALYIPYGNGIYTTSGVFTGNINVSGTASVGGRLVVGGYDAGWQVNLASGSTGVITNGRFYQRGNGGYYCYDAGDFAYGVGIAGSTLVQRDGAGQIQAQAVYMPQRGARRQARLRRRPDGRRLDALVACQCNRPSRQCDPPGNTIKRSEWPRWLVTLHRVVDRQSHGPVAGSCFYDTRHLHRRRRDEHGLDAGLQRLLLEPRPGLILLGRSRRRLVAGLSVRGAGGPGAGFAGDAVHPWHDLLSHVVHPNSRLPRLSEAACSKNNSP
jgi:hypothetical protein